MFLCDQYAILVNESIQRAEDNNQNIPLKLKKKKNKKTTFTTWSVSEIQHGLSAAMSSYMLHYRLNN